MCEVVPACAADHQRRESVALGSGEFASIPISITKRIHWLTSLQTLRCVPEIIYSIVYNALSLGIGLAITKLFRMLTWTSPAIAFNNTTSLPLLLERLPRDQVIPARAADVAISCAALALARRRMQV